MLNSILADLVPAVTAEEHGLATIVLSRYAARLSRSREFNRQIKRLPPLAHKRLRDAKQRILDRSDYFLTRLWRAVYEHLRYGSKVELAAAQFEVSVTDVSLILRSLTPRDRIIILRSRVQIERLAREQRQRILTEIRACARRLVRRLRFIAKYDSGVDLSDLEHDLVVEGYNAFQQYEHFGDCHVGKILNYVRSSMSNRSINIINHYTSQSRAAVSSERNYRCPACKYEFRLRSGVPRGQCPRCHTAGELRSTEREFVVTRVSLDDCMQENNLHLHDFEARTALAEPELSRDQLLQRLKCVPDRRVRQFFQLIDRRANTFRRWLGKVHGRYNINLVSLPELGCYAREYLGITVEELAAGLEGVIDDEVLAWHCARFRAAS
jgi:hypothetical protein